MEAPPEKILTAIDRTLIHAPDTSSLDATISYPQASRAQSVDTSATVQLDELMSDSDTQAHSQSVEQSTSGQFGQSGNARNPYSPHDRRFTRLQKQSALLRQEPYRRHKARRPGPTSAPCSSTEEDKRSASHAVEKCLFSSFQDQTTVVMGMLMHVDTLTKQCEDMRTFIRMGFDDGEEFPSEERSRVEQ